ncbi:MAG: RHS repeat-associated core domain-containing protein [Verrucomicrobiota bacterium]|nr:RHS repeat-associated core domain-containing protein [Verrucomicrobiota bacterium]
MFDGQHNPTNRAFGFSVKPTNAWLYSWNTNWNVLTWVTDPEGRTVESYALDLQDRPVTVTNLEGQTMSMSYGVGDYMNSITRFDGTTVGCSYNTAGLLSGIEYPGSSIQFAYLKNGLPLTAVNKLGTVSNAWSFANRLTAQTQVAPSGTVTYAQDPAGNVTSVTSVAGTTFYSFDEAERLSGIQNPESSIVFSHNTNNGLVCGLICINSGVGAAYSFDALDRVTGIVWTNSDGETLRSFAYTYSTMGLISSVSREDGGCIVYGYDGLDRLTSETQKDDVGKTNLAVSLAYDLAGNRAAKTRDGITIAYTNGTGNRLAAWSTTATNFSVTCDVSGYADEAIGTVEHWGQLWVSNNTTVVTPAVDGEKFNAVGFAAPPGTQQIVAAICDIAGNTSYATSSVFMSVVTNGAYSYNAAGCVAGIVYSGCQYSRSLGLTWDGRYQLVSVSTNGAVAESYGWDALGRRVYIAQGTTTNWLIYDGVHAIAEVNGSGQLRKSFTWGSGIDNLLALTVYSGSSTNRYLALTDHLGTVHALADSSGSIVESYRFDAWGRVLGVYNSSGQPINQSAVGNRFLWAGKEYSWATGLYHNRARTYDPVTGRFLSKDPSGISGGLRDYLYCHGDPINFIDFDGLRDVNVYVWRARGIIINPSGSAGHIMVTEYKSTDPKGVILGQFPHKLGEPRASEGPNNLLSWKDTCTAMGRPPDEIYTVFVPDDKAFDDEACKQRKRSTWNWRPMKPDQTHCSRAAYDALKAGGVPVPANPGQAMPGTLGDELKKLMKDPKAKVRAGF